VRTHSPDDKDHRRERELFEHPLYRDQLQPIAELIALLRTASDPADYRRLHQILLGRFLGAQQFAEDVSSRKREVRAAISAVKGRSDDISQLRTLSMQIKDLEADLRCVRAVLSVYRTIGDALVWKVMDYRRELITPLGEGKRVGHLAKGAGLESELAEIEWLWTERDVFALHADITNCVRHGDVLSVETWEPKSIRLTEIKASGFARPDSAQMLRLSRLVKLANDGFHPKAADGHPLTLQRCPVPHRTHLSLLGPALEIAATETYIALTPEPGLLIEVFDDSNPAGLPQSELRDRQQISRQHFGGEDDLQTYSIYNRRLRDRVQSFSGLAPLPLLPLRLDRLCELLLGRFDVAVSLHAGWLERRLDEAGIRSEVARGADTGDRFLRVLRGEGTLVVPATVREQVLVELLTLDTLVETLMWLLRHQSDPASAVLISNVGEMQTWTSYPLTDRTR
jgi:hypothetical protein